jgi:hypothetical protein
MGLSDSVLTIGGIDETTIIFSGTDVGWVMNGRLDKVTGSLVAASIKSIRKREKRSCRFRMTCNAGQRNGCSEAGIEFFGRHRHAGEFTDQVPEGLGPTKKERASGKRRRAHSPA